MKDITVYVFGSRVKTAPSEGGLARFLCWAVVSILILSSIGVACAEETDVDDALSEETQAERIARVKRTKLITKIDKAIEEASKKLQTSQIVTEASHDTRRGLCHGRFRSCGLGILHTQKYQS